ncbi:MAG: Asp-tRNA(Asn)/Glu-tRNA(Gln) amidotransferase subunit GatA [Candidatus Kerfeldbacteria bacterium]|nr:Asp-tRNA(Asn)/Glu-tRNA(Gln) amidotransferase subunit GatA [Candidatus Kerfeldbacteria bacterium]
MLKELRAKLDNKEISAVQLTQHYLDAIKIKNPALNAYVNVTSDYALAAAAAADEVIAAGKQTMLTGIPYAVKDIYCVQGIESTGASNILKGYKPPYTATVIKRLPGAVLLGKTNSDEFAMGASTENSCFGPTLNPYDPTRVAGGSSGGSAAAVAADLAVFSFGSDTGGSVRQPASFCGIVGLRPTYGRISRYGVMPMASSMDTVGPFAKTVEDLALLLEQVAGFDPKDGVTSQQPVEQYSATVNQPVEKLRIGIVKEYFELEGLDPAIRQLTERVINQLATLGAEIVPLSLPHTKYAVPAYYVIVPSEVSSNLARFDGIRYGYRAPETADLLDVYTRSREQGFGDEAKRRIMIGTYALSAGYYDAYYAKAMKVRTLIRQDFVAAFKQVDVLLAPPCPGIAFKLGEKSDPIQMYLEDVFAAPASLAGLPGLVVPAGQVNQLPVGVQIMGPQLSEALILRVGRMIEGLPGQ